MSSWSVGLIVLRDGTAYKNGHGNGVADADD